MKSKRTENSEIFENGTVKNNTDDVSEHIHINPDKKEV